MDLGEAKCRPNRVSKRLERDFEELLDDGRCLHRTGFHYIIDKTYYRFSRHRLGMAGEQVSVRRIFVWSLGPGRREPGRRQANKPGRSKQPNHPVLGRRQANKPGWRQAAKPPSPRAEASSRPY